MYETSITKATLIIKRFFFFAMDDGFREFIIDGDNITIMKSPLISGSHLPQTGHIVQDVQCLLRGLCWFSKHTVDDVIWLEESPPPALEALYSGFNPFFTMNETLVLASKQMQSRLSLRAL